MIQFKKMIMDIDIDGMAKAAQQASQNPLMTAGFIVMRSAKKSMRKYNGKASKPMHPPKSRTGRLRRSIRVAEDKRGEVLVGATPNVFYGAILEHGGEHLQPRPFMLPALKKEKNKFPHLWEGKPLGSTPAGRKMERQYANFLKYKGEK